MNRPNHLRARFAGLLAGGALIAALFPMAGIAMAAPPSVAPATGGAAISLDTSSTSPGLGTYTSLTGPVVTESTAGTFADGTIVLSAPTDFRFDPSSGSAAKTGDCSLSGFVMSATAATVTFAHSTSSACVITFSGLRVRPTGTTPVSETIANSGTATGLPGGNYGTLAAVAGAPILTITRQASTPTAGGTAFGTQPQVTSMDRFGNLRSGDVITLAISTRTAPGVLTCPTATTVAGVATFVGCSIDKFGAYTLLATTPGQAAPIPVSSAISITVGTAAKLIFYQVPTLAVVNAAFPTQPIVAVADAGGNLVPSGAGSTNVTLTLTSGTGSLLCIVGPSNVPTQSVYYGVVASFSGCRLNTAGLGDVITATATGGTFPSLAAATATVDVENQLVFAVSPTAAIGGAVFPTQPVVTVQANSLIATNDSATVVTLSIASGTGAVGATLTCSSGLSRTVVAGVATFTGCSITKLSPYGIPYQLVATTSTGLSAVYSATFAVTVGPAVQVGFATQPGNANVAQVFPAAPVVAIQDAGGNTITSGTDSNRSVTLAILSNPAGGTLTCSGGLTVAAVAGLATFTGCTIDRMGSGYSLLSSSTGLNSATSSAFNVTAPAAQITITTSAPMPRGAKDPVITWGQAITLRVQFAANGAGKTIQLQGTRDGVNWATITNLTMSSLGNASFVYTPVTNLWYRAVFAGTPDLSAATSNQVRTVVREIALLRPTNGGSVRSIARNTSVTVTTTVRPARPELAPARVTFWFYHQVNGSWVLAAKRDVVINSAGLASTAFAFTSSGQWYVREAANPTPYNANSVLSQVERYSVY